MVITEIGYEVVVWFYVVQYVVQWQTHVNKGMNFCVL